MSVNRKLVRKYTPKGEPGFLGRGHIARPVIQGTFSESDPFILLMDDLLDKKDTEPVGGPHPHAGFETVSLLLEGEIGDEKHQMKGGDFQIMTAGSGIVHTETIDKIAKMRLLQLWVNLPKQDRNALPRLQDLPLAHVPKLSENGVQIKLYSGSLAGLSSPVQNYTPMVIADMTLDPRVSTTLKIPANYNTFLYIIDGSVNVGEPGEALSEGQVGWLDIFGSATQSELNLSASDNGVRLVLYAGKPTGEPIVSYGPFIADSTADIQRLFNEYSQGKMKHISVVPESQRIML